MYEPDTILKLKEQRDPDEHGNAFPYNLVKVIGASPVVHSGQAQEWVGAQGQGVMIQPCGDGFGATLDEPFGKLQQIYDVESVPVHEIEVQKIIVKTPAQMGPSPEEVFAALAEPSDNEGGRRWVPEAQRVSPLPDERPKATASPLDKATPAAPVVVEDVPPVGAEVE